MLFTSSLPSPSLLSLLSVQPKTTCPDGTTDSGLGLPHQSAGQGSTPQTCPRPSDRDSSSSQVCLGSCQVTETLRICLWQYHTFCHCIPYFLLPPSERATWRVFLYAPDGGTHVCPLTLQVFKEERYLCDAYRCADVVWQYGLLKKGYGLCHGAAGNAYAFLALFNLTHDVKFLYRACKVRVGSI